MELKIIKIESDYHKALDKMHAIFDLKTNTKQFDETELLMLLIERYKKNIKN